LQALHAKYNAKGLSVLGFPCNQFGLQEPGTDAEIKEFCTAKYAVAFDLFSKINVNGDQAHGLYKHLTAQNTSPKATGKVSWNFEKFLIDRSGTVIARFDGKVKPDSAALVKLIEQHLAK
jgi:glutathione peroxidase